MEKFVSLEAHLEHWQGGEPLRRQVAEVVLKLASAAVEVSQRVRLGRLGPQGPEVGERAANEIQQELDRWTQERFLSAVADAPLALVASKHLERPVVMHPRGPLALTIDPLDGSSNIDTNVSLGTLFSVLPAGEKATPEEILAQPGRNQLAAGYVMYGPHCALALSLGAGTHLFTLDGASFRLTHANVATSRDSNEYAINASNYRFWSESIRAYIDDCIAGTEGARGEDVNMRWVGSLVAEAHRILVRGGVFLHPRDSRRGNERGRLFLVYEASPIAFLVENAGGKAIDGFTRILDLTAADPHQRTPLMFGSASEIDRIARYKANPSDIFERSPLFGQRGLLKV